MYSELGVVFRAMKEDSDGKPQVGRSARTLGIRISGPRIDIPINDEGKVRPKTGGMSVTPDTPYLLPKPRLPKSLGGEGRDPVFSMNVADLPSSLALRRDKPSHALVEPLKCCLFQEFEQNLHGTRGDWVKSYE